MVKFGKIVCKKYQVMKQPVLRKSNVFLSLAYRDESLSTHEIIEIDIFRRVFKHQYREMIFDKKNNVRVLNNSPYTPHSVFYLF